MSTYHTTGALSEAVTGRRWSPAEVATEVALRSASHVALGLSVGDRCLIVFGNRLEFFAELLAIWSVGACAIPVDARLSAHEIDNLVAAAGPTLAVIDEDADAALLDALSSVRVVHTRYHDVPAVRGRAPRGPHLDEDALILFTSGSTGQPKGVVHTHRSLRARWTSLRQALGLEAYARTLCVLPTHFGHGLICNCLFPWLSGCDLCIAPPFRADVLMRLGALLDEQRITFLSSVPSLWNLALRTSGEPRGAHLRRVHIGSAPLSGALWGEVQRWSGTRDVGNVYGITETGSWVVGTRGDVAPEDGLVGEPWGARVRIVPSLAADGSAVDGPTADGPTELAADCRRGEEGMIWLDTPALMKAYYRLPALTDEVVRHGWFNTGDIGVLDDRGRLIVRGRERDEINKGGMKVFPADIDVVVADDPNVLDACAFGYADLAYGENVALAVVLRGHPGSGIASVHARLEARLAEHKRPLRWYVLDEIPRTSRGKINRARVSERCAALEPLDLGAALADAERGR